MSTGKYAKGSTTNIDLFCRNADGEIVIVSKVWMTASKGKAAVSLYVGRGIMDKALRLVHREFFDKSEYTKDMLLAARDTVPLLWAMHFGVSDFVVVYAEPKMSELYHPTELAYLNYHQRRSNHERRSC
jgi:hypothetical protein